MAGTDTGRLLTKVDCRLSRGAVIEFAVGSRIEDGRETGGRILDGDEDRAPDETGSDIVVVNAVVQDFASDGRVEDSLRRGKQHLTAPENETHRICHNHVNCGTCNCNVTRGKSSCEWTN